MATETWHDLGPVPGACSMCRADGTLSIGEVRVRQSLSEVLRRDPVYPPSRLVGCRSCGWRWTVRSDDSALSAVEAVAARQVPEVDVEPRPQPVERRQLPAPRVEQDVVPRAVPASPEADVVGRGRHARVPTRTVLPAPRERRRGFARLR